MRNIIELKKATKIETGDYILSPQFASGILLAHKVISTELIDGGKRVEIGTTEANNRRLHVLGAEDMVAIVL